MDIHADVRRTARGTAYLREPGVVLLGRPATNVDGLAGFLAGFEGDFAGYVADPDPLPAGTMLCKVAGQTCFDDRTEILAESGWKRFPELDPGEAVLTLDPQTLDAEYQRPLAHHAHPYDGWLLGVEAPAISFAVTPDHRQFGFPQGRRAAAQPGFVATADLRSGDRFAVLTAAGAWGGRLPGQVDLPAPRPPAPAGPAARGAGPGLVTGRTYRTRTEIGALACLLAHYVADRSAPAGGEGDLIFRGARAAGVAALCAALGLDCVRPEAPRAAGVRIRGSALPAFVRGQCGREPAARSLPRWVLDLPRDELAAVWHILARAAARPGETERRVLTTPSPTLAGQAQEILCKLGCASRVSARRARRASGPLPTYTVCSARAAPVILNEPAATPIRRRRYRGFVYCVTTANGVVCVRRRGRVHFSGNCYMSFGPRRTKNARAGRYFANILEQGHGSVLEHANYTLLLYGISRSVTHELVRHRHLCFSQQSQRYVGADVVRFVERPEFQGQPEMHAAFEARVDEARERYAALTEELRLRRAAEGAAFAGLRRSDQRKAVQQAARALLPNETEAPIVVTGNVRSWRHVIAMRCAPHAEPEIRRAMHRVWQVLRAEEPLLFGDYAESPLPDGTTALSTAHPKV